MKKLILASALLISVGATHANTQPAKRDCKEFAFTNADYLYRALSGEPKATIVNEALNKLAPYAKSPDFLKMRSNAMETIDLIYQYPLLPNETKVDASTHLYHSLLENCEKNSK